MPEGLVVTFSDITSKKANSEKIERSYAALKAASHEIKETNYKLEQSNFDLLQFASVASHDLKEPLRKIQVFGNLLQETSKHKLDESETNYLGKIINSSNRMQMLIDNILILSRLSNNTTPYSAVNLNEVIKLIKEDLEVSIKDKAATIIVEELPVINGIQGQLHQLFQNLISNALKFNVGQPVIKIGQRECTAILEDGFKIKSGDFYCIYIQDNGIGFDAKFSDKIFGIFQRLEQTSYEGTGIGLAIVKKIVDNHNGFIKATSEPGKGACFIIFLPKANTQLRAA
jgi:two-component system CheB/CheR fusion protein